MLRPDTLIQTARPGLRGTAVEPGDPAYDGLRLVHNAVVDRRPALIARVADADDVAAALAHARARGLAVSVRGGGHSAAGHGVVEGGVVIDMRALKDVHVRVASRTVRVGAGVTVGELDAATQAHGLAVTGGREPSVGVVGFTLGSGSGWLERTMGLAADNLLSAELVTADGRHVTASADEHPDLFWALKGGGGNFGVVTELRFALMPVGPTVLGGLRAYPVERMREVVAAYRDVMGEAPDELCGGLAVLTAPPLPFVPEALRGRPVVAAIVLWAGDAADGPKAIAPLGALGEPALDLVQPMPYTAVQSLIGPRTDGGPAARMRTYAKFGLMQALSGPAIDTFVALAAELPTPQSAIVLHPLGGAFARVGDEATALGARDAAWGYQLLTAWPDRRGDAPNIAWTRAAAAELSDHARCAPYPNFVSDDDRRRLLVPYPPATLARLKAVKQAWDPDNVFASNHNIRPA